MERKIFEELLELKRLQTRTGRSNETHLVKSLSDSYANCVREMIGLKNYDGPFTFKDFEKYLYSKFFLLKFASSFLLFICTFYVVLLIDIDFLENISGITFLYCKNYFYLI
jgi:hypothetical protein